MRHRSLFWTAAVFVFFCVPLSAQVVTIGDVQTAESAAFATQMNFPVTLSSPALSNLSIPVTLTHITTSSDDFLVFGPTSIFIQAGATTGSLLIFIRFDSLPEPAETFQVDLTLPAPLTGDTQATGTILDDDGRAGTADLTSASTLLFPHFEVDYATPGGRTTAISITNREPIALLVNLTLWTEFGLPTENFEVYLTGYDTITYDLADLFVGRLLPRTATDGQDPMDTISPQGPYSQDINFASCNDPDNFGAGDNGPLAGLPPLMPSFTEAEIAQLRAAHSGSASSYFGGLCGSASSGDTIARGYVTADMVNSCEKSNPSTPGYFTTRVWNQNYLFGDYSIHDPSTGRLAYNTAVHVEARPDDPTLTTPGNPTFYQRLVGGTAEDQREPLGNAWGADILRDRTTVVVWRDALNASPAVCGFTPAPLEQFQLWMLDYDATFHFAAGALPFGFGLNLVEIGAAGIPFPSKGGWLFLNSNISGGPPTGQSYVTTITRPEGLEPTTPFGVGAEAIQLGNTVAGDNVLIP